MRYWFNHNGIDSIIVSIQLRMNINSYYYNNFCIYFCFVNIFLFVNLLCKCFCFLHTTTSYCRKLFPASRESNSFAWRWFRCLQLDFIVFWIFCLRNLFHNISEQFIYQFEQILHFSLLHWIKIIVKNIHSLHHLLICTFFSISSTAEDFPSFDFSVDLLLFLM